jgi:transposase-like protein
MVRQRQRARDLVGQIGSVGLTALWQLPPDSTLVGVEAQAISGPVERDEVMSDNEHTEERREVDGGQRGRPGRRSVQDRKDAVLQLLAGKAKVDQLARQYGLRPETVEGWRADALSGVEEALRRGGGPTPRERELEREVRDLRAAGTDLSIDKALLKR